jgi:hypothetical protein
MSFCLDLMKIVGTRMQFTNVRHEGLICCNTVSIEQSVLDFSRHPRRRG